jgi:Uncharacterised nucleotidyltransferase
MGSAHRAKLNYRGLVASSDRLRAAAQVAIVDAATVEVVRALRGRGIRCLVLKGPGTAAWLYADAPLRPYGDTDLLVAPWDRERVGAVLTELGYVLTLGDDDVPQPGTELHAETWRRERTGSSIDLHRTLNGARAPAEDAWRALSRETDSLRLGGIEIDVPTLPGRALHVVLHAAYHGALSGKPVEDLTRALERADEGTWRAAAGLAAEVDALDSFAAGLRLLPAGQRVAETLGLPPASSVEVQLKAGANPPLAISLQWLAEAPDRRARVRLLRQLLVPPPAWVRESYPFARRGRRALVAAYLVRLLRIPRYGLQALVAWQGARRHVSGSR